MRIHEHWLQEAERMPSEHCAPRRPGVAPDTLVIHCISLPPGQFAGGHIAELFTGRLDCGADPYFADLKGVRVSAHLLIERSGAVRQFVPFDQCAWHAGASRLGGRQQVNDFSIGIELEGLPDVEYEPAQYRVLAEVSRALCRAYPQIVPGRIVGHCDVAPGRKNDPGTAFDWRRYFRDAGLPAG